MAGASVEVGDLIYEVVAPWEHGYRRPTGEPGLAGNPRLATTARR